VIHFSMELKCAWGEVSVGDSRIWRTKLAAWLHDPSEKALILLDACSGAVRNKADWEMHHA